MRTTCRNLKYGKKYISNLWKNMNFNKWYQDSLIVSILYAKINISNIYIRNMNKKVIEENMETFFESQNEEIFQCYIKKRSIN